MRGSGLFVVLSWHYGCSCSSYIFESQRVTRSLPRMHNIGKEFLELRNAKDVI